MSYGHPVPLQIQVTPNWAVTLHQQFTKAQHGNNLQLMSDDLNVWFSCILPTDGSSPLQRMERDALNMPLGARLQVKSTQTPVSSVTYLVDMKPGNPPEPRTWFTHSHGPESSLMIAFQHHDDAGLAKARDMYATLDYTSAPFTWAPDPG